MVIEIPSWTQKNYKLFSVHQWSWTIVHTFCAVVVCTVFMLGQSDLFYSDCSRRWSFMFFPKSFQNLSLANLCCFLLSVSQNCKCPKLFIDKLVSTLNCFNKATVWIYLSLFVVDNADVQRYQQQIKTKNINIGSFEAI